MWSFNKTTEEIKQPKKVEESENKYIDCELEYFPKEEYWYAKYRGQFIFDGSTSYSLNRTPSSFCLKAKTQEQCKELLDKYLETKGIGTIIVKL